MKTETVTKPAVKPQCVDQGGALLCFIPGEGVIQLRNGKYSISKRENRLAKPLQKDIWHKVIHKTAVIKRDMTEDEIKKAKQAMIDRKKVLDELAEKRKVAKMRKRPRMRAGGRRF